MRSAGVIGHPDHNDHVTPGIPGYGGASSGPRAITAAEPFPDDLRQALEAINRLS